MSRIMFFCIPAHGHFNPTREVILELIKRGHQVRYYLTSEFQEEIESIGASFVSIESYMPTPPDDLDQKVGKDFALLIEMIVDTTLSLDTFIDKEIREYQPDCIVSDSLCFWGKLFAKKYQIPFICSTTSLAFNQYTAKLMKKSLLEIIRMFKDIPRINKKIKELNEHGYQVENFVSIIQNDNETNTIVYTTKKFQPMSETFSNSYAFIGPSICQIEKKQKKNPKPLIYISLGTVLNNQLSFYKECIEALKNENYDVIISVGKNIDISQFKDIPSCIQIYPKVHQIEVLSKADAFITHCGMNSVNEALYYGVPMVLFPQHSEENAVAISVEKVGAGLRLKHPSSRCIKEAVQKLLSQNQYQLNALEMSYDFQQHHASKLAADYIERIIHS